MKPKDPSQMLITKYTLDFDPTNVESLRHGTAQHKKYWQAFRIQEEYNQKRKREDTTAVAKNADPDKHDDLDDAPQEMADEDTNAITLKQSS